MVLATRTRPPGPARLSAGLPPGPDVGVWPQTLAFHRDPLGFLRKVRAARGDVFSLRLLTARPLVVVADRDAAEALLDADPEQAQAGEGRRRILPFASPRSLFGGDGELHRAARERLAPAFSEKAMEPRREAMEAIAARQAGDWPRGRPFRLLNRVRDVADEIFVRLVLGVRDEQIVASLTGAMRRMLRTPGNPPITLPGPGDGLMGALGERLFERRRAPLVRELTRAVAARRREADGEDVLGLLLADGLDTGEIVDELSSLLMAAQEPPSLALGWLLDRLSREPDLRASFLADPRGGRAEEIVRETLRRNPPASGVLRRLRQPLHAGGWLLPAGVTVLVPTTLMHRDRRFYFPFGGGERRCIGEALARTEIETVVPAVLGRVRLTPLAAEPEPMVQRATVLAPKRGLLVRAA